VSDGLPGGSPLAMPSARTRVKGRHVLWLSLRQQAQEHLAEQPVIAVPVPVIVQGDEKEILALQAVDDPRRVGGAGNRVAQGRGEPVEDGRPAQEFHDRLRLTAKNLFNEEFDDKAVVTAELPHELARGGLTPKGEGSEVDAGRPSLGAFQEDTQVSLVELDGTDRAHQFVGLHGREAQLRRLDLGQVAGGAQPADRQRGVDPGNEHDLSRGRKVRQEERHVLMTFQAADQLVVVHRDDDRLGQRR
jgi:hypothetical protein